ncbi:MAG TPA: energy transducer TonB [Candidatus Baltobacteraceae bacterium]|nr:energy transducer TonB [Candidatus Baltobacteraceae bacterium]
MAHAVSEYMAAGDPELGRGRVTIVQVTVGPNGKATNANVYNGSGSPKADAAAIAAAMASTYAPAMNACHPVVESVIVAEVVRPDYTKFAGPKCTVHHMDAIVLKQMPLRWPQDDTGLPGYGVVSIQVTIGPDGEVAQARVAMSSGYQRLDDQALYAAENSIYAPKVVNCVPVSGTYAFNVTFQR